MTSHWAYVTHVHMHGECALIKIVMSKYLSDLACTQANPNL